MPAPPPAPPAPAPPAALQRLAQTGYQGHRCARPHEPVVELDCTPEAAGRARSSTPSCGGGDLRAARLRAHGRSAVWDACGAADPARAWCAALDRAAGRRWSGPRCASAGGSGRAAGASCGSAASWPALHRHATGGACRCCLTAQPLAEDAEGRPGVAASRAGLVREKLFPPACRSSSLILANANVWMGCAPRAGAVVGPPPRLPRQRARPGLRRERVHVGPGATNVLRPAGGRAASTQTAASSTTARASRPTARRRGPTSLNLHARSTTATAATAAGAGRGAGARGQS